MAGLQKEIWKPEIIEFLEDDNEFMRHCVNADQYVVQGNIVHIPQAGTPANIVKNRGTLPAPVRKRVDDKVLYALDEYTSDPIVVTKSDQMWLSYDKRQSIIREKMKKMQEDIPTDMLYNWAVNVITVNVIKTSGTSNHTATAPNATGNRKNFVEADVRAAQARLNKQKVSKRGRFMLIDSDLLNHLEESMTAAQKYAFKDSVDVKNGVIGRLWGFNIMERGSVLASDSSDAVKAKEAAGASDDNVAALYWQSDMVERAYGDIDVIINERRAEYYGDVCSSIAFAGGRQRRKDGAGVGLIVADV